MGGLVESDVAEQLTTSVLETGDAVVVWRIDRLGRSLIDVLNTVNGLRDAGINARSLSDGASPATSTGWLMLKILATLAEDERELIIERVDAGITAAREAGIRFGRPKFDPAVVGEKLAITANYPAVYCVFVTVNVVSQLECA